MKATTSAALLLSILINKTAAFTHDAFEQVPGRLNLVDSDAGHVPHNLVRRSSGNNGKHRQAFTQGGMAVYDEQDDHVHVVQNQDVLRHSNEGAEQYYDDHGDLPRGRLANPDERKQSSREDAAANRQLHKEHSDLTKDAVPPRFVQPPPGQDRDYHPVPQRENQPQGTLYSAAARVGRANNAAGIILHPDPRGRSDSPSRGPSQGGDSSRSRSRSPSSRPSRTSPNDGPPARNTRSQWREKNRREVESFWDGYGLAMDILERDLPDQLTFSSDDVLFERDLEPEVWLEMF